MSDLTPNDVQMSDLTPNDMTPNDMFGHGLSVAQFQFVQS